MCKRWAIHFKFIYPRAGPRDSSRDISPQDTQCAACATWGNLYQHATEVSIVRTDTCTSRLVEFIVSMSSLPMETARQLLTSSRMPVGSQEMTPNHAATPRAIRQITCHAETGLCSSWRRLMRRGLS